MKNILFLMSVISLLFLACNKELETPYDHPFFYIHQNNVSEITVQANRNESVDYKVYFSTKTQFEAIEVDYEVVAGEGLKAGVDFEVVNTGSSLLFKPGVVEMPIKIRWINHPVEEGKDNTLTIRLLRNDKNITLGLPGPDHKQSSLKITKI
ncbi:MULTISPECIES: hypothetical protein [unclassified Sphingobacterium]|uniref:hypothetical protein n=1 Tax=unclassified Sphingobacterium TaxID=2609468 RepID=UPI0025FDF2C3|nr:MULTISPECIES: hypothetical protein [unclassified Sphingobacterium]